MTNFANNYRKKLFGDEKTTIDQADSEFIEFWEDFALDDVINQTNCGENAVDDKTRIIAILATLLGCGSTDLFKIMLKSALNINLSPIIIKEVVYQSVAYLGFARVYPFMIATNEIFESNDIKLPLKNQSTTTRKTRLQKGIQAQVDIFGDGMKEFYKSGAEESKHINRWLAENCFGDYYTRNGLDYKMRELVTFCCISAQGGCEPQLTAHAMANMKVGNNKQFLINIVSSLIPYIGYPRSLNALRCLNEAEKNYEGSKN